MGRNSVGNWIESYKLLIERIDCPLCKCFVLESERDSQVSYTLSWQVPGRVLYLALDGQLTVDELHAINQDVVRVLDRQQSKLNIIIDTRQFQSGYQTVEHLRATQHYMDHPLVDSILVVADNKLNRLISLLTFSLSQAKFVQFNSMELTENHLRRRGLIS